MLRGQGMPREVGVMRGASGGGAGRAMRHGLGAGRVVGVWDVLGSQVAWPARGPCLGRVAGRIGKAVRHVVGLEHGGAWPVVWGAVWGGQRRVEDAWGASMGRGV